MISLMIGSHLLLRYLVFSGQRHSNPSSSFGILIHSIPIGHGLSRKQVSDEEGSQIKPSCVIEQQVG